MRGGIASSSRRRRRSSSAPKPSSSAPCIGLISIRRKRVNPSKWEVELERGSKLRRGLTQPGSDRALRDTQRGGDLGVAVAVVVAGDDGGGESRVERAEGGQ